MQPTNAVRLMADLGKPIVSAVQGSAAGAGLSLVLLSDIVYAAPSASFATAYTSVGLTPDCGQSWLLPRAIGTGRALELTLTSRRISADEGATLGIVSQIVAENRLLEDAHACAVRLANGPTHALGAARSLIRAGESSRFQQHLELEASTIARMAATRATADLIDSFLSRK